MSYFLSFWTYSFASPNICIPYFLNYFISYSENPVFMQHYSYPTSSSFGFLFFCKKSYLSTTFGASSAYLTTYLYLAPPKIYLSSMPKLSFLPISILDRFSQFELFWEKMLYKKIFTHLRHFILQMQIQEQSFQLIVLVAFSKPLTSYHSR